MTYEIERKFLVTELPKDLESYPHNEILQGYITISDDGTEERVRKKGMHFFHTIKSGDGLIRQESEKEISEKEFDELWIKTDGKRIYKTRYDIEHEGYIIELDVFCQDLQGLVVAEVEFSTEEHSFDFVPPKWFGNDITNNKGYKNRNLAIYGMP